MVSFDCFEIFCVVVDCGFFSVVVDIFGQMCVVVSFNFKWLEVELGVFLFSCSIWWMVLIDVGECFYQCCVKVFDEVCLVIDDVCVEYGELCGSLCVIIIQEYGLC